MRTTEIMTISLPLAMVQLIEEIRKKESRTRSELVREAFRVYIETRYPAVKPTRQEVIAIRRGRAAFKRGDYITLDELHRELESARNTPGKKKARKNSA